MRTWRWLILAASLLTSAAFAQFQSTDSIYSFAFQDVASLQYGPVRQTIDLAEADLRTANNGAYATAGLSFAYYSKNAGNDWRFTTSLDYRPYGGMNVTAPAAALKASAPNEANLVAVLSPSFKELLQTKMPPLTDSCPSHEGDPCVLGYGNQYQAETDFTYGNITFSRYYNSLRVTKPYAAIDSNWSHSFTQRVLTSAVVQAHGTWATPTSAFIVVQDERAHNEFFKLVTAGTATVPGVFRSTISPGKILTATTKPDGTYIWTVYYGDGRREVFDTDGRLTNIQHPENRAATLTIAYVLATSTDKTLQDFWLPYTVADGTGRQIKFVYQRGADVNNPYKHLAKVIEVHNDNVAPYADLLSFDYDTNANLWKVHRADATVREYKYGETDHFNDPTMSMPHHLTGIIDENGKRYSDFGYDKRERAAWSHHAGNAELVTTAYVSDTSVGASRASGESVSYTFPDPATDQTFRRPTSRTETGSALPTGTGPTEYWVYGYQDATCTTQDERICRHTAQNGVVTEFQYDTLFERVRIEGKGTTEQRRIETDYDVSTYRVKEVRIYAGPANTNALVSKTSYVYGSVGTGLPSGLLAKCEIDPQDTSVGTYQCSATVAPPVNSQGVRRWIYGYCAAQSLDVQQHGCPAAGWLQTVKDPRGNVTTYSYFGLPSGTGGACTVPTTIDVTHAVCNQAGDIYSITDAETLSRIVKAYTYSGKPQIEYDANMVSSWYAYDVRDRLRSRSTGNFYDFPNVAPDRTASYTYDNVGNVVSQTDEDNVTLVYAYDDAHRLIDVTDALSNRKHFTLDTNGNHVKEEFFSDSGVVTFTQSNSYDLFNRLWTTTNASGGITTHGYDSNGNVRDITDELGIITHFQYDGLGRLKTKTENYRKANPAQTPTQNVKSSYGYDSLGRINQLSDPDNLSTTYVYDSFGNLKSEQSPDTGIKNYSYDLAGNRVTTVDARPIVTAYTYDAINRPTATNYPSSILNTAYYYDESTNPASCANSYAMAKGNLTRISDSTGSTIFCYDSQGKIRQKKQVIDGKNFNLIYEYTKAGRITVITYPSGAKVTYTYDAAGEVSTATYRSPSGTDTAIAVTANHYPFGPLKTVKNGSLKTLSRTYDNNYWISSILSDNSDGLNLSYTHDSSGKIIGIRNPSVISADVSYAYDSIGRLTNSFENYTGSHTGQSFTYNATGDRTTLITTSLGTHQPPGISYNYATGTHHLTERGNDVLINDSVGNLTSANASALFTYGESNRLNSFSSSGGSATYAYLLNALGQRAGKKTIVSGTVSDSNYFVYNETGQLVGEYGTTGSAIKEYFYFDGGLYFVTAATEKYYIETDHLDTPRGAWSITNQHYVWSWPITDPLNAFGSELPNEDPDTDDTFFVLNTRFPGQYFDSESALNYNYYRNYKPADGRYIESDPLGLKSGINTYAYVGGRPLTASDPFGLWVKYCTRVLYASGSPHSPMWNPVRHDYINISGKFLSFTPAKDMEVWGPGKTVVDEQDNGNCTDYCPDNKFDKYVIKAAIEVGAPTYCPLGTSNLPQLAEFIGLFGGINCQWWAQIVLEKAKADYLEHEECPECFK